MKQINTLLYCLGEEAEGVLTSTSITAYEWKVYDTVLKKFDAFFKVRRNVIYEKARFNWYNQLDGRTVEQYIMVLDRLAESCNYGGLKDEIFWGRLVVGIWDAASLSKWRRREFAREKQWASKTRKSREQLEEISASKQSFITNSPKEGNLIQKKADTAFLDTVTNEHSSAWFTIVKLNEKETKFKLNTGAEVTAIFEETCQNIQRPQLSASEKIL